MKKHLIVEQNTKGRDFIVGDIHGEFQQLTSLLSTVQFDRNVDRLFSVGDIIDRGPDSPACLELLNQSWFYMVRGNHETMMIEAIEYPDVCLSHWYSNGGLWSKIQSESYLQEYVTILKELPLIITIKGLCHIVHAELTKNSGRIPVTDEMVEKWLFSDVDEDNMQWGRNISVSRPMAPCTNLLPVYVGHTIFEEFTVINGHHFLDQGACMTSIDPDFSLAIINPKTLDYAKVSSQTI